MGNPWATAPYYADAVNAARAYGLDPDLFTRQIGQESGFDPKQRTGKAYGIAQFMPETAREYGVDRSDPISSLNGAARMMSKLVDRSHGDYVTAMQRYGTLPKDLNKMSKGQREVFSAIAAKDGIEVDYSGNASPAGFWDGGYDVGRGTMPSLQDAPPMDDGSAMGDAVNGLRQHMPAAPDISSVLGNVETFFERAIIVIFGLVLIAGAVFMLGRGKNA